jgi:putative membrane protein
MPGPKDNALWIAAFATDRQNVADAIANSVVQCRLDQSTRAMPISDSDPRVFFAAERTLLAWLRTGLTIIALGFVVSRFGLFVQLLATQSHGTTPATHASLSAVLGVAFVIVGALAILVAAVQHQRFVATLPQTDLPRAYSSAFALGLSLLVAVLGMALAGYLLFTQP